MTNLISESFESKEKKLVTFVTGGDPDFETSLQIIKTIINNKADILEIGMPFSDPMADGPTIQLSSNRAISKGIDLENIFSLAAEAKKIKNDLPIILMGYYNLILYFGIEKFVKKCKENGVDGLIIVDLPYPENKIFSSKCKKNNINFIQLISPTTSRSRLRKIINDSHDMIYYISMLSTTGGKLKVSPKEIIKQYQKIKNHNKSKNVVIGFGITEKTIESLKKADGLVVGSAICKEISKSIEKRQNAVTNVTNIVKRLKNKIT